MFRFLHAADVHLDSPLLGLQRYPHAPIDTLRQATRRAFTKLIDLALAEKVQFLLLAGDLYDGDWKDYHVGLFLRQQLERLSAENIRVFIIQGNHDAANRMTRSLSLPDHVVTFPVDAPATHRLDDLHVALHGQSFPNATVTEDLSQNYPPALQGFYNIGLLHTCLTGREGHERYAPCTIDGLKQKGYDYWALGHIHQRDIVCEEPWIVFPGNVQGRHIRETGPKGCYLATVDDAGNTTLEFRELDVLRWQLCQVDVTGEDEFKSVIQQVATKLKQLRKENHLPLAVRLELIGETAAHDAILADADRTWHEIVSLADSSTWIEKVQLHTAPPADQTLHTDGPIGELMGLLQELRHDERALESLVEQCKDLTDLSKKLQQDTGQQPAFLGRDALRELIDQAGPLLTRRLLRKGAPR